MSQVRSDQPTTPDPSAPHPLAEVRADAAPRDAIAIENPATGEMIAHVERMDADRVEELVARARLAQPAWAALGFAGRRRLMLALRHWLVEHRERVVDVVVAENGKTREDALLAELFYVADSVGFWAKRAERYLGDEKVRTHSPLIAGRKVKVTYRPLGVVGVIAPWNYPLTLGFGDALPALMAGNAVIIKPSEVTPLATQLMAQAAAEVGFPDGVFQVATGDGETGAALVERADMIMFTGSTATGRKIGARCGERLIPCSLELGGKDPMIVLADADLERAANVAVEWSMRNAGQICVSVERVYVEAPVYDAFVEKVVRKVGALRQGRPEGYGSVDVGAITFPPQLETIARHVDDAVSKGATVLVGGHRGAGPGRFFEPTVLVDVDHTMDCMTQETFGPTLPIMKIADEEEGIRLANAVGYGLGSSVFSKDVARAERVARRINAGVSWVNDAIMSYLAQEAPFGGAGQSGVGARHGQAGIRKYTQAHTIMVSRWMPRREPTMFPNTKLGAKVLSRVMVVLWGRKPR